MSLDSDGCVVQHSSSGAPTSPTTRASKVRAGGNGEFSNLSVKIIREDPRAAGRPSEEQYAEACEMEPDLWRGTSDTRD